MQRFSFPRGLPHTDRKDAFLPPYYEPSPFVRKRQNQTRRRVENGYVGKQSLQKESVATRENYFPSPISKDKRKAHGRNDFFAGIAHREKYDLKTADKIYIGLIKDLHHMEEIDYIVSDG